MPNLQRFMSEIGQNGFQKSNWFDFRIPTAPSFVEEPIQQWLATGFICTSVSLPGRGFATADQTIYGFSKKVPYFSEFPSLTCTFVMPIDTHGYDIGPRYFNNWMNRIQNVNQRDGSRDIADVNFEGAFDMTFPARYYAEAEIRQYSYLDVGSDSPLLQNLTDSPSDERKKGAPLTGSTVTETKQVSLRYRFKDIYPVSVEAIPLSWADTDSFTQLSVTFNYSYWTDTTNSVSPDEQKWGANNWIDYTPPEAPPAPLENRFNVNDYMTPYADSVTPNSPKNPSIWSKVFGVAKNLALDEARFRGWIK